MAAAAHDQPERAASAERWRAACRTAAIYSVDPFGLAGIVVSAWPGPAREAWLGRLIALQDRTMPVLKMPPTIGDDRLLGGLDLAATLASGRRIFEKGLLADAAGGLLVVPGAERLTAAVAAHLAVALDRAASTGIGCIALDEGAEDEQPLPGSLVDRLAFTVDLDGLALADLVAQPVSADDIAAARARLTAIGMPEPMLVALVEASVALDVGSPRVLILAVRAARAIAALDGAAEVGEAATIEAARLVLAPRARRMPEAPSEPEPEQPPPEDAPEPPAEPPSRNETGADELTTEPPADKPLADVVLEAIRVALPAGLLGTPDIRSNRTGQGQGRFGARRRSRNRGRQIGSTAGLPRGGQRLDLLATLRAAAPWQKMRRRAAAMSPQAKLCMLVRKNDFRVRRFEEVAETLTIFVVDASGSAALHRLGEAKGAVELLLADCYVRRDSVALIAFRGRAAAILLPPTRSLARAKRALSRLPGGGGTPLAGAMLLAGKMAEEAARRGQSASLVVLSDCGANVALDGGSGRARAEADAMTVARQLARSSIPMLLVDTAPRPQRFAAAFGAALDARYLALPVLRSGAVAAAARSVVSGQTSRRSGG